MRSTHIVLAALVALGCAPDSLGEAIGETGVDGPFGEVPEEGKYDGSSARGPQVASGSSTEVWSVQHAWTDVTNEAGLAWERNSGLDWEQKYDAWIGSLQTEPRRHGSGQTFIVTTPYGDRSIHAPTLECAEVGMFLRATFASWYHLPFYLQGWDAGKGRTMYAGHFGFVDSTGARVGNFPTFRSSYRDYESGWAAGRPWPSDARLRGFRLGDDDGMDFLSTDGSELGAGAYFDEIFLNKRVGYFMRLLLLYFGSANLADGANMFHIQPEATSAGDLLVKRWQRRGIGHVLPIFRVTRHSEDALEITIASGSMPRREPLWEEPNQARSAFTSNYGGGVGEDSDGNSYASLGGGVRRWRTATLRGGRWQNDVSARDRDVYINSQALDEVAARPARFEQILRSLSTEERREVALQAITAAREHLRNYPASCSARVRREDAFDSLYEVQEAAGMSRSQVDATYRTLEDYVLSALVYEQSRTCCWNRSTNAMHGVIMDYAEKEQAAAERDGMCVQPTAFRAETNGYERWSAHAATLGAAWNAWSEDEACSQRNVPEDSVDGARAATPFCERGAAVTPIDPPPAGGGAGCDATGGGSRESATRLGLASARNAEICAGDEDWYLFDATGAITVRIDFDHASGDLDMEAVGYGGERLGSSASVQNEETVTATGPFFVRVFGYSGAANTYTIVAQ